VPWIHDLKNTDLVIAVDDETTIRLLRLFNQKKGRDLLRDQGVANELIDRLDLLGISGVGNLVAAIKLAKYYELSERNYVVTVLTDSMELYGSRMRELNDERGEYTAYDAHRDIELMNGINIENMQELSYYDKKRIHNLKYFTWIEQQGRDLEELNRQWYDHEIYWGRIFDSTQKIDELIGEFNDMISS
jgi:hypothetical protein